MKDNKELKVFGGGIFFFFSYVQELVLSYFY